MAFPTTPNNGDTTTINSVLYTYDSSKNAWLRLAPIITGTTTGAITVATTAPTLTVNDQVHIWINSDTNDQYVLIPSGNTTQWKELVGSGINGATGATGPSGDDGCLFPDLGATGATGATGLIPAISTIVVTDEYWEPLPYANSVDTNGGYIRITGAGFLPNCWAFVGQYITATTYIKETEVGAIVPALPAGFYTGYLVNPGGGTAILLNGIHCDPLPQWITTSPLPHAKVLVPTHIQLNATTATNYRMAANNALPAGLTLHQHGLIDGLVQANLIPHTTTFNFTVIATDAELQDAVKALTLVVEPLAGIDWTLPGVALTSSTIRSVVYSGEREEFVAILEPQTNSAYPQAMRSDDGLIWTKIIGYPMGGDFPWPVAPVTWNTDRNEYITYYDKSHVVVGQGSSWTKSNLGPYYAYQIAWMGRYIASGMQLRDNPPNFTPILQYGAQRDPLNLNRFVFGTEPTELYPEGRGGNGIIRSVESGSTVTVSMTYWGGSPSSPAPFFNFGICTTSGSPISTWQVYRGLATVPGSGIHVPFGSLDSLSLHYEGSTGVITYNYNDVETIRYGPIDTPVCLFFQSASLYSVVSLYMQSKGYYGGTMVSNDGVNWTNSDAMPLAWGSANPVKCVIVRPDFGQCLAIGLSSRGATSEDGISWEYHRQPLNAYTGVWGNGKYVIGGTGGLIASSTDGITWTTYVGLRDSPGWGNTTIYAINWNGTQYIVVGPYGRTAISQDLITWTYTGGWTNRTLYAVTWTGSSSPLGPEYMAAGVAGTIGISK